VVSKREAVAIDVPATSGIVKDLQPDSNDCRVPCASCDLAIGMLKSSSAASSYNCNNECTS
jgi:hypothetical protein